MINQFQWAVLEAELDPAQGSEQAGRRPVLVISNEPFNQAMPNITVLPLTTTERRLYPAEVLLPKRIGGQPRDSIVLAHQIRTISKQRVRRMIGYLDDTSVREKVQEAVRAHLDLD
jgi:mRNA interferase MazF